MVYTVKAFGYTHLANEGTFNITNKIREQNNLLFYQLPNASMPPGSSPQPLLSSQYPYWLLLLPPPGSHVGNPSSLHYTLIEYCFSLPLAAMLVTPPLFIIPLLVTASPSSWQPCWLCRFFITHMSLM